MNSKTIVLLILAFALQTCGDSSNSIAVSTPEPVDPMAEDSFFMRNPEILEDLLAQLVIHDIEHWINDDNSIGFRVKDTEEVDRLANEAIGVYISLQ